MKRAPQAGSKAAALRAFFEANPGEFLSYADITAKFELNESQALKVVQRLREEGTVKSGVVVWLDPERPR